MTVDNDSIFVTRPYMPPLEEYTAMLERIWEERWLTNAGCYHQELEHRISAYLGVENLSLFCNGTLALMVALQMLRLNSGEVITTPFTFPATVHVLFWNRIQPVFCDIDPKTYNLDPNQIEKLITPDTRAILPVHVYGTPCDVDAIQAIAERHGLHVIYDAAHTFGARYRGRSISSYGDASILSFHATKLFSTAEGGALVVSSHTQKERVNFLKNFGIADEENVIGPGINGKMNELQAAFGLLQLKHVGDEIAQRREIDRLYREELGSVKGLTLPPEVEDTERNYAYFPILIDEKSFGMSRDDLWAKLRENKVYSRKYFFPLCSHYSCYSALPSAQPGNLPVAERTAQQVLCLPIFGELTSDSILKITGLIKNVR